MDLTQKLTHTSSLYGQLLIWRGCFYVISVVGGIRMFYADLLSSLKNDSEEMKGPLMADLTSN